jgi:hypothetical protein
MTPKEKAWKLFNKYYSYLKANLIHDEEAREDAKECALIAVNELIFSHLQDTTDNQFYFWEEVKQEIEKL